jgi:predicted NAD-dependent protein-ADP-ribosyltransferase YbiA (DUF1768 family)
MELLSGDELTNNSQLEAQKLQSQEEEEEEQEEEEEEQEEEEEEEVENKKITKPGFGNQTPEVNEISKEKEKKKREKKPRTINPPKDSKTFFKARRKFPNLYTFTRDGNLQVPATEKGPAKVIELPFYRHITEEEIAEKEELTKAELIALEKEFDETLGLLRDAIAEWRETGAITQVGEYQDKLQMLDAKRTILRSGNRWTVTYKSVSANRVDFSNRYEERKIPYNLYGICMRKFAPEEEIIPSKEDPFAKKQEEEEEKEDAQQQVELTLGDNEEEEEEFTFFYGPEQINGFLSPDTVTKFIYNGVEYNSLIQAYHGVRFEKVGRKEMRAFLLNETSPRNIRNFAKGVVGDLEDAREVWIALFKQYVSVYPEVKKQLAETGESTIAYADPKDLTWGIGISMENPERENRAAWTGQNILGQAWMAVRAQLDSIEEQVMEGGNVKEVAKTLEDVKRRSGVLMNSYKMKKVGFH